MTSVKRTVATVVGGFGDWRDDLLAEEAPIELRLQGVPLAVLMRTPGRDVDLARGFALTEGIVLRPDEITTVEQVDEGDRYELVLSDGVQVDPSRFQRSTFVSSSCGVCGKASIDAVRIAAQHPPDGPELTSGLPRLWIEALTASQPGFGLTGGLHAAAVCEPDGTVLAVAEDVGRHNAVDKAVGRVISARWPLGEVVLAVSGRISFEIAQKAAVAGIPVVAAVSAASSLAAELAEELGMTLIGFVRGERFVVYSGPNRFPDITLPTA